MNQIGSEIINDRASDEEEEVELQQQQQQQQFLSATQIQKAKDILSTLPTAVGLSFFQPLCLYQNFWCSGFFLEGVILAQEHFKPNPGGTFICSPFKSGTTWLKALAFAITTRSQFDLAAHPLLTSNPHDCVPGFLHFGKSRRPAAVRLMATHTPYASLPRSVLDTPTVKIVYICRDLKDVFVSLYYFVNMNGRRKNNREPISLEDAFELFCEGKIEFGPHWDHMLGFSKASKERPEKILFLKYEDMKREPVVHAKEVAAFIGCPFSQEEEKDGIPEKIAALCSFETLSNLEVNKAGSGGRQGHENELENAMFFRKGATGDWKRHLTPEMAERLDKIAEEKFQGTGFAF